MSELVSTQAQLYKIVEEELQRARLNIGTNIDESGKKASGRTAAGMQVIVANDSLGVFGQLRGRAFFGALEQGSQPWATQYKRVPKFFVDIIAQWIKDKGLDLPPWAVATKLMREGSAQYRAGERKDIYSEEIEATVKRINERILGLFEANIVEVAKRRETLNNE